MKIIFVTTEQEPAGGGDGAAAVHLLSNALRSEGHEVETVLVSDESVDLPPGVTQIDPDPTDVLDVGLYLAKSRAAAKAVAAILLQGDVDLAEFQDFGGLAYVTLADRNELGLERTRIAVRMHGPADLMLDVVEGVPQGTGPMRVMEAEVYRMADVVVAPSEAMRQLLVDRYQLEPDRVTVGVPPVPSVAAVPLRPAPIPEIAYLGRFDEADGAHDFVEAATGVLTRHPQAIARLIEWGDLASGGRDPEGELRIPEELAEQFQIERKTERADLATMLSTAWMVALPRRFESFSAPAYQVRSLGLPLVLPDLPAFQGQFGEETGALIYAPSAGALEAAIERLVTEEPLRERLTAAPPPQIGDPKSVYLEDLPPPRHPRSQSGLATAAGKRLEEASVVAQNPSLLAGLLRRAFRAMPAPVARVAVRLVPQVIKDRVRPVANWREEAARRSREDRLAAVRQRIDRGDFSEIDEPLVGIVIPCFDQGPFLEEALISIFEQTFPYFEVVVVDDGSRDAETIAILDKLDWPRTRMIRHDNRGPAAARNTGMGLTRAPFVVPLDADDELAPDFLAELVNALDRHPEAAYAHCWAELFGDQRTLFATRPFNRYQVLLSNPIIGCVVMRRHAWEQVNGYDESMIGGHEDWELWIRLLRVGWGETVVRRPLFRYRKHGISMSVGSEARFEQGRAEIRQRHPELYELPGIKEVKTSAYPWVSIIMTSEQVAPVSRWEIDDAELVAIDDDTLAAALAAQKRWGCKGPTGSLAKAVAAATGKFLIVADSVSRLEPDAVRLLAEALEAHPTALGAAAGGASRPVLWRHWPVVDRGATHRSVVGVDVDIRVTGDDGLRAGAFPQPGWDIGDELEASGLDLRVQRQAPEEEGRLPTWLGRP